MTEEQILVNLKSFRMKKNPKAPFQVFPDSVLNDLMAVKPKTIAALTSIKGFPKDGKRVTKYGEDIIGFFKNGCKVEGMSRF